MRGWIDLKDTDPVVWWGRESDTIYVEADGWTIALTPEQANTIADTIRGRPVIGGWRGGDPLVVDDA